MATTRRRSLLYAPAHEHQEARQAAETNADVVVLDLDAMVPADKKAHAHDQLESVLSDVDFGEKETCVRINDVTTEHWLADAIAAVDAGVDIVRLPMIETVEQLFTQVDAINQLTARPPDIIFQLETPRGLLNGKQIGTACHDLPNVVGVSVGIKDYTEALGAPEPTPSIREFALHFTSGCASIGNLDALGTGFLDPNDLEGLREAAEQARALGHVGQPVIHPDQVDVVNDVYGD